MLALTPNRNLKRMMSNLMKKVKVAQEGMIMGLNLVVLYKTGYVLELPQNVQA